MVGGRAGPGGGAIGREEEMPFKQAGLNIVENVVRYLTAFYFYDVFFFLLGWLPSLTRFNVN